MIRAITRTYVRPRMGTLLAATLPVSESHVDARYLDVVFQTASSCDGVMSRHRRDTDLSRLNALAGDRDGLLAPELARILAQARALAEATDGAFDPTVTPVSEVWRRAARVSRLPSRRRVRAALAMVGWKHIDVRGPRVALARPGMAVDLGAFGKGLSLDHITARLREEGCSSALLNFGESSLAAIGRPRRGRWMIVLRHPMGGFVGTFPLGDRACSTSGSFGQTLRIGARQVSHVVDPRTGRPAREMAQVTVLARSGAVAEAASTALLVLGRSALDDVARRLDVDACWIDRSGVYTTPWFRLQAAA